MNEPDWNYINAKEAQLGLFADRVIFGENVRAMLKALDELPGTVPIEKKNET